MDVSIIIINYKTPNLVIECVESIYKKTYGITFEIIVVDNSSNDGSVEIMKKALLNKAEIIESSENLGYGRANNLGVRYAHGEYLFLLNSDTILVNNAVKILLDFIRSSFKYGVVGGNLLSVDGDASPSYCMQFDKLDYVKRKAKWVEILVGIILKKLRRRLGENCLKNSFNDSKMPIQVAYIFGADMMLSRKLYNNMNGFDADFFMYSEEQDLSWRITNAGYQIWNVPDAQIVHLEGASMKKSGEFNKIQYKMRMNGKIIYFYKRYGKDGSEQFYRYKKKELERTNFIAKLLKRTLLYDLTKQQIECLNEAYIEYQNKKIN